MLIFTASDVAKAKLVAIKREVKGNDFRSHNGARGQLHQNKKRKAASAKWRKGEDE